MAIKSASSETADREKQQPVAVDEEARLLLGPKAGQDNTEAWERERGMGCQNSLLSLPDCYIEDAPAMHGLMRCLPLSTTRLSSDCPVAGLEGV